MTAVDQGSSSHNQGSRNGEIVASSPITGADSVRQAPTARWTTNIRPNRGGNVLNQLEKESDTTLDEDHVHVLLVEDNRVDAELIQVVLTKFDKNLSQKFLLKWVQSVAEAIGQFEQHPPDVVLLDLNLPDASGLESLKMLRPVAREKPIIVLTGQNDAELGTEAIRNGAQDYLWKNEASGPHLSRALRFALERAKRQRIEYEVAGAGFIQQSILSAPMPSVHGVEVAARCDPAEIVAGDFYDVIRLDNGSLCIVLGDVSGKGLGPALLMAETRGMIRSVVQWETEPGQVLTRVNALISEDCIRGSFVTVFLALLTPGARAASFGTAGHEGFLLDSNGRPKQRLANPDPPLGIQRDHVYRTGQVGSIRKTDQIFACTDGVTEAFNPVLEQNFGNERVFDAIGRFAGRPADGILDGLYAAVRQYRDFGQDDMTAILARTTA